MRIDCRRAFALIASVAAAALLAACAGGRPAGMASGQHRSSSSVSTASTSTSAVAVNPATTSPATTTTTGGPSVAAAGRATQLDSTSAAGSLPAPTAPPATHPMATVPPAPGPPAPPPTSPPSTSPPPTYPWPPPSGALPPGPPPTNYGPYGGYGLWYGTCQNTGGEFGFGQITTHWDQYRGTASVQYLEMVAGFSSTSTPRQPVPGVTYTNIQNVNNPSWGQPIPVGARHQDGPLYLEFRSPTPHSVISAMFYWLDANRHVLWQSPTPLTWSC